MSAWWAPRSSKLVKGVKVFGGFDSRPPPPTIRKYAFYITKFWILLNN
jgi:hypothetical protein